MQLIMTERLLEQLHQYEGRWVALFDVDGEMQVVASGDDALVARDEAANKGYTEATLMKVLQYDTAYVPAV
jgi:hypothetical protein